MTICFSLTFAHGQTWSAIGNGVNGRVSSFAIYNGELYVGGQFDNTSGVTPFGIMKWNGTSFDTLPGTYLFGSSRIEAMVVYNNELYVGGAFCPGNSPYGSIYRNIARWNGVSWDSVGNGFNNVVYSLAVYNGNLYAGGDMSNSGSVIVNSIAKWDGNQWAPVANGVSNYGRVSKLEVYNNKLFAAGDFSIMGSAAIAQWNDTTWNAVGAGGINGVVYSLGVYNNELYAGGPYFTLAGGVSVNEIAKWNGITWASVGSGIGGNNSGDLFALREYHNELYAGGDFSVMDGNSSKCISRYDGASWNAVGSGVDSTYIITDTLFDFPMYGDTTFQYAPAMVSAFMEFNNELYVGGTFNMIGSVAAHNIAKWSTPLSINEISLTNQTFIYPNPFSFSATLHFNNFLKNATLTIYNSVGQQVKQIKNISEESIILHRDNLKCGVYFLQLTQDNKIFTTDKLIIIDN